MNAKFFMHNETNLRPTLYLNVSYEQLAIEESVNTITAVINQHYKEEYVFDDDDGNPFFAYVSLVSNTISAHIIALFGGTVPSWRYNVQFPIAANAGILRMDINYRVFDERWDQVWVGKLSVEDFNKLASTMNNTDRRNLRGEAFYA